MTIFATSDFCVQIILAKSMSTIRLLQVMNFPDGSMPTYIVALTFNGEIIDTKTFVMNR